MIYENENRGTAWEPDPEQAAAMERRQRKQFSHVGLAAAAFMLITLAAQMTVMVLVGLLNSLLGDFIDFYGFTGRMLMSSLPMYLVAFPAAAGLLQLVPKCGSPQKEQWGFWKFASFFVIAVGIGLAGNILGKTRTVSVAIASETAAGNFDAAGFWVVVIVAISFLVVAVINIVSGKGMKVKRWM